MAWYSDLLEVTDELKGQKWYRHNHKVKALFKVKANLRVFKALCDLLELWAWDKVLLPSLCCYLGQWLKHSLVKI